MPAAARMGDKIKQDTPHCHAPIHPAAPVPTPVPHPGLPLTITGATVPTVMIEGKPAAALGSISTPCSLPSCVPNGPGMITMGSASVFLSGRPAARQDDMTAHVGCVAPIPSPVGKVIAPCASSVIIGG
ncbi:MAG TPA: PAAR domain-containing protein [Kofleriaceae bacterium]|nr:PAAR domain-containing protein [Kofleriaceae bacterium]